ncbi:hypothetical protein FACS1894199_18150 [Bacteroidia bacterium]|nr:hypothetical protein FACS1894199_18150 [Bacteroidia bacterium]
MTDMAKKELPDFPDKMNLYDFTEFPRFDDSDGGKESIKKHKRSIRNGNIAKLIVWVVFVVAVLVLFSTPPPFWAILVVLFGGGVAWKFTKFSFRASADIKLQRDKSKYCTAIAQFLVENHFKDTTYFCYFTDALIYNNSMCAYFSTKTGDFVIYNKTNLKDVVRERVHVGTQTTTTATTTGKSERTLANSLGLDSLDAREYKSTTKVTINSREIYEWHLDILTDFMPYPKVTIVLPDEKWAEDEVGKAYGILKL